MRDGSPFPPTPTQIHAVHALEDVCRFRRDLLLKILVIATDWYSVIHTHRLLNVVSSGLLAPHVAPERLVFLDHDLPAKLDCLHKLAIISDCENRQLLALDGFARALREIDGEFEFDPYFQDKQVRNEFAETYASAWSAPESSGGMREMPFSSRDYAIAKPRFTLMLLFAGLVTKMPNEPLRAAAVDVVNALLPPNLDRRIS